MRSKITKKRKITVSLFTRKSPPLKTSLLTVSTMASDKLLPGNYNLWPISSVWSCAQPRREWKGWRAGIFGGRSSWYSPSVCLSIVTVTLCRCISVPAALLDSFRWSCCSNFQHPCPRRQDHLLWKRFNLGVLHLPAFLNGRNNQATHYHQLCPPSYQTVACLNRHFLGCFLYIISIS